MVREISSVADFEDTIKNNKVVVVDFHAVWCGPCKFLAPVLSDMEKKVNEALNLTPPKPAEEAEEKPDNPDVKEVENKEDKEDKEDKEKESEEQQPEANKMTVAFIKVDVDVYTNLARKHDVSAMPTILVFNDQALVKTIVGANPAAIQTVLKEITGVAM